MIVAPSLPDSFNYVVVLSCVRKYSVLKAIYILCDAGTKCIIGVSADAIIHPSSNDRDMASGDSRKQLPSQKRHANDENRGRLLFFVGNA